jgi:hypothetical protein
MAGLVGGDLEARGRVSMSHISRMHSIANRISKQLGDQNKCAWSAAICWQEGIFW